ncbi:MAG: STT3 domain-containing protein [Candidatus Woesearchaeota archaeon]
MEPNQERLPQTPTNHPKHETSNAPMDGKENHNHSQQTKNHEHLQTQQPEKSSVKKEMQQHKEKTHANNHPEHSKEHKQKPTITTSLSAFIQHPKTKGILKVLFILLLLLIPMGISYHLRSQTIDMPLLDRYAESRVLEFYKGAIAQQVESKFGYLPKAKQQELVEQEFAKFAKENKERIEQEIAMLSEQLKEHYRYDETGYPYLHDIDTYLQYQYTKNYVEHGHVGNVKIDGISYMTYRDGRHLHRSDPRLHPWMMAQWYKVLSFFNKDMTIAYAVFLFPIFLGTLAVIPAFFLGRRLGKGWLAGLVAATLITIALPILLRTIGGVGDNDVQNLFMPLLILWLVIESWEAKNPWVGYSLAVLGGIAVALFRGFWGGGWWFVVDFLIAGFVGYVAFTAISGYKQTQQAKKNYKQGILSTIITVLKEIGAQQKVKRFGVFFISSMLAVTAFVLIGAKQSFIIGIKQFFTIFTAPFGFLAYKAVGTTTIWPNVMTTVAELSNASIAQIIGSIGGPLFFALALLGIGLALYSGTAPQQEENSAHQQENASIGAKEKSSTQSIARHLTKQEWLILGLLAVSYLVLGFLASSITNIWVLVVVLAAPLVVVVVLAALNDLHHYDFFVPTLLAASIIGTFIAAVQGVRFIALLAIFTSLAIGITAQKLLEFLTGFLPVFKNRKHGMLYTKGIYSVLLLFLLFGATGALADSNEKAKYNLAHMNDAWYDLIITIKETSEDAIITSWWDFGHWFYSLAERRVTFDGGDQGRRIHWVGKVLLTEDEQEAIHILRMLNCDQEAFVAKLEKITGNEYDAIKLAYQVLPLTKSEAKKALSQAGLTQQQVNDVMQSLYCDELLDQYFIASEDMVGKSSVWAHFGIWDFDRAYVYNSVKRKAKNQSIPFIMQRMNVSRQDADRIYAEIQRNTGDHWISPWPGYAQGYGGMMSPCIKAKPTLYTCRNGFMINTTTYEAFVLTEKGKRHPKRFAYLDPTTDAFTIKTYTQDIADPKLSFAFVQRDDQYYGVMMDDALTASMFTRMFFFEGKGLQYFVLIKRNIAIDGQYLYLYKVDWNATRTFWDK